MSKESHTDINAVFSRQVCINLDRRPERWQKMQRKFERHGIHSVRRFSAVDGENTKIPADWSHTPGAFGCLLSHLQIVGEARRLSLPNILIFEDDTVFDQDFANKFRRGIQQLPSDWDMLFFGALHKDEPVRISEHISRITKANSTYAYVVRDTVFDEFIELNRAATNVLDINSFRLQARFNCYCFTPNLAWVEAGHSDAQKRFEDYWYLKESLVLFGSEADRLLSDTTIILAHANRGDRSNRNLRFLVDYFHEFFSPLIRIVIVEQGPEQTVDSSGLPGDCKYVFRQDGRPFNRALCFKEGISAADPSRRLFILSDDDIYLETLDIRANLLMCERYGGAAGFNRIIDLSNENSRALHTTKTTRGIDIARDPPTTGASREGVCCFLNRESTRNLEAALEETGQLSSSQANEGRRMFASPNHALRLCS